MTNYEVAKESPEKMSCSIALCITAYIEQLTGAEYSESVRKAVMSDLADDVLEWLLDQADMEEQA